MPRIAYLATNKEDFYNRLSKLMDISARSLKVKRDVITKLLVEGLYPYTKAYLGDSFESHFSTIGLIGMNEVGLNANWLRKDMTHQETQEFSKEVLNFMREKLSSYQELYGDLYNLEATPAESTTYRFAKHDKKEFPNIITAGNDDSKAPYYTNSSHLPVDYTADIFDALDIQDELQTLYTSGTVFHAFLGEKLPDWKAAAQLVKVISENYKLPYYTMSPTYSVCAEHGYIAGESFTCPKCGAKTEVYSRITGYYRPIQNWNDGKAQEYKDRLEYEKLSTKVKSKEVVVEKQEVKNDDLPNGYYLLTTKTCPNCKRAKDMLERKNVPYIAIDVDSEPSIALKFNVMQAPTLISIDGVNWAKYPGIGNIVDYLRKY